MFEVPKSPLLKTERCGRRASFASLHHVSNRAHNLLEWRMDSWRFGSVNLMSPNPMPEIDSFIIDREIGDVFCGYEVCEVLFIRGIDTFAPVSIIQDQKNFSNLISTEPSPFSLEESLERHSFRHSLFLNHAKTTDLSHGIFFSIHDLRNHEKS